MTLRRLTLTVVLAVLIGGTVGAAVASATTRITCGAGITCPPGQAFNGQSATSPGFTLTNNLGNLQCTVATIKGTLGSNPVAGSAVSLTITSLHVDFCVKTTPTCSIAATNAAGVPTAVSWSGSINDTTMTINNPALGLTWSSPANSTCAPCQPGEVAPCSETCTYGASSITGSVSGSDVSFAGAAVLLQSGVSAYCPSTSAWDMTFRLRTGTTAGSGTLITVDTF